MEIVSTSFSRVQYIVASRTRTRRVMKTEVYSIYRSSIFSQCLEIVYSTVILGHKHNSSTTVMLESTNDNVLNEKDVRWISAHLSIKNKL